MLLLASFGPKGLADEPLPPDDVRAVRPCEVYGRGAYISIFGGGGVLDINNVNQVGTALFSPEQGGPLNVNATGYASSRGVGLLGLHVGHEWNSGRTLGSWNLLPAVELEGFYLGGTQRSDVSDPNNRLNGHVFADRFPLDNFGILSNVVLSFQSPERRLTPYLGLGLGTASVGIHGADSLQVVPDEPNVNHFNSNPDSAVWAFAAQAKVGARFALTSHAYLFAEYRFLYVGSTTHTFGSTQYPTHAPTTPWTVHLGDTYGHMAVVGMGFNF